MDPIKYKKSNVRVFECKCECGKTCEVRYSSLINGKTKSCGCLRKETISKLHKHYNTYDLSNDYGIGFTEKGEKFYFDLEDYDKIKDYCWYIRGNGYVVNKTGSTTIHMHRIVMGLKDDSVYIDHVHGSLTRNDNRKSNLRIATHSQNMMNVGIRETNTSGVTGVDFVKRKGKWRSRITKNNVTYELGYYDNFNDAVKARKEGEERYHEKFSYENSRKL